MGNPVWSGGADIDSSTAWDRGRPGRPVHAVELSGDDPDIGPGGGFEVGARSGEVLGHPRRRDRTPRPPRAPPRDVACLRARTSKPLQHAQTLAQNPFAIPNVSVWKMSVRDTSVPVWPRVEVASGAPKSIDV